MVFVTFRCSNEKLTSMFSGGGFKTVEGAKKFIEQDAKFFLDAHKIKSTTGVEMKFRQKRGWKNPKTEDYFEATAQDGTTCIWQYWNRV